MEISSTERYLALVMGTLENVIVPQIATPEAKAMADLMKFVLVDLIKRERFTPRLLAEHLDEGRALLQSMVDLAEELGALPEEWSAPWVANAGSGFNALADIHRELTDHIARLTEQLHQQRSHTNDAARQQPISALIHKAALWEYGFYASQRDAEAPPWSPPALKGGPLSRETLEAFMRKVHPDGERCSLESFEGIPGGFGKLTYRFTLRQANGELTPLIARKSDPTPMVKHGGFFIDREFELLKNVAATGVLPVAAPLYLGVDVEDVDADFYVMSMMPGKVAGSFLGAASAVIPESVILHMAELLARLHNIQLDAFAGFFARYKQPAESLKSIESCYRHAIAEWREYFAKGGHLPSPFVTYMIDWLERHLPANHNLPVLVHGDFNIHNVLVEDGRVTGVLDWECANFGAPEQDMAYIKPIISKHIVWERFLDHYRQSGGPRIDESSMNFYMAFSAMRLNIVFNKGTANLQAGVTQDIRYALVEMGLQTEFMKLALASTGGNSAS